jgi:phage shock protein PspC (stress-responsive transcriptional regulator)/uncharacterized membrane protein
MEQEKTEYRFFGWMRTTGIQRENGWIGGVAAGVATKIAVDPLVVRGILVVLGILGAPVLILYGVAWLLLPDTTGRIHLEEATRGRFSPAIAAIGVMIIASLLPLRNLVSFENYYWQNPLEWFGGSFWTVIVVGLSVAFVAWVAHRVKHHSPVAVVNTVAPDVAAASTAPTEVIPEPDVTGPETADAPEDFTAWREQQEATKAATEEFRATGEPTPAEVAAQRAAEHRALWAAQAAAQAEQRERRRRANPRLSAAWVFVVLGVALVASAIGALVASVDASFTGSVAFAGVASASLVVGIAIIIAGAVRRRSGFLSFVAAVLLFFAVPLAFLPGDRQLVTAEYGLAEGKYAQLAGNVYLYVQPGMRGTIDLWQGVGNLHITMSEGAGAHFEAEVMSGYIGSEKVFDDNQTGNATIQPIRQEGNVDVYSTDLGNTAQDLTIRLWQGSGSTYVSYDASSEAPIYVDPDAPIATPSPTESPE